MSTNFYVYPGTEYIPTFKELLDLGNGSINEFLSRLGGLRSVVLNVELHNSKDHNKVALGIDNKVTWNEEHYAWFYIKGIKGGTDSYFYKTTDLDKTAWQEEYVINSKAQCLKQKIDKSLEIGYHWSFRRSAGQSGTINLSYGLLAASLAKVTDGFIYSDDGAWDYSFLPAVADDFFEWYFNPDYIAKKDNQIWVKECINSIREELNNGAGNVD